MAIGLMALVTLAALAGCGGGESEARRQQAAILAELQAIDQGIASSSDVAAALEKYTAAATRMNAFQTEFAGTPEAKALEAAQQWLEEEMARLRIVEQANVPPPKEEDSSDLYK